MKKWYKESYFNHEAWLLENFDKLNLSNDETLLLLYIEHCRKNRINISYDTLCCKFRFDNKKIDLLLSNLVSKGFIKLAVNSKGLSFDLDGLYEFDPSAYEVKDNEDFYDLVSTTFGRPLSTSELQKLSDLSKAYSEGKILEAIRIAEANRKLRMSYVEGILRNEEK